MPVYPNSAFEKYQGLGMTSQRTRSRLVERLKEKGIISSEVLNAINIIPRHLFIDEAMASRSYEDTALPIGYGQTISQPLVVARMTEWLLGAPIPVTKVLEIGTGSGYQTALLALLFDSVFSVERISDLSLRAQNTLNKLELNNIEFAVSDGHWGWPQNAPFDVIISAASPTELPMELMNQLRVGGRLIIPLGDSEQQLFGFEKTHEGYEKTLLADVLFVPMKQGVEV